MGGRNEKDFGKVINLVHEINMYKVEEPATMTTDINIQEKEKFGFVQRLSKAAVNYLVERSKHTMLEDKLRVMIKGS
jgi:hypothetical protein